MVHSSKCNTFAVYIKPNLKMVIVRNAVMLYQNELFKYIKNTWA